MNSNGPTLVPGTAPGERGPAGAVLVSGGGIGGVQSSLDLVEMGYRVYLVDRAPSIGGVMGQLDKTFPTNDCSMCILSPKLVEVGSNHNISLYTLSEIAGVEGEPGRFMVTIRVRPRYVDLEKCTGCGTCSQNCRVKVKDPYDAFLQRAPLIRVPFPQAVPGAAYIDPSRCLYLLKGKCGNCLQSCPAGAVDFTQTERLERVEAGAVILASGFRPYDARRRGEYGYGEYPNVVTGLEFERILAANGPTGGHVVRRSDAEPVRKLAFIQCVGSRDTTEAGSSYCSSVCCMYSTKQAIVAREHDSSIEPAIFFIDMRAQGKGFEEFYNRAEGEHGVRYIRCLPSRLREKPQGTILITYTGAGGRVEEEEFDMVVLATGLEAGEQGPAAVAGVDLDRHGFVRSHSFIDVETSRTGIYVCGCLGGPGDIPTTVVQASAAASLASAGLVKARGELLEHADFPEERDVHGEEPRVGAVICRCGTNIASTVDVEEVVEHARSLPGVVFADERLYACSQDAQEWIRGIIHEHRLNRLLVASCTPRTHQPLFRETMKSAGLNSYLLEMANIREHCSWVHREYPRDATDKARRLVAMGVEKARLLEPLEEGVSPVTPAALVIGAGGAGLTAALRLAEAGFKVYLVEKEPEPGGQMRHIHRTSDGADVQAYLERLITAVREHPLIQFHAGTTVNRVEGYIGSYRSTLETARGQDREPAMLEVSHGVVIVTTGGDEYVPGPGEYLWGEHPRVITLRELERRLHREPDLIRGLGTVVFIQCVGSRNEEHPYCSRVCCSAAVKNAHALKDLVPGAAVHVCYRDMRTYGSGEDRYLEARDRGINFIRYTPDAPPRLRPEPPGPSGLKPLPRSGLEGVCPAGGSSGIQLGVPGDGERVLVTVGDGDLGGEEVLIAADLVVLSTGIVAGPGAAGLGPMLKVPLTREGFFLEAHVKLRPVDFATDGVFLAGMAHYPATISECLTQACAAAARAETVLSKDTVVTEGVVAVVEEGLCSGCRQCLSLCGYEAISFDTEKGVAVVNRSLCKGCGACAGACVSGANRLLGFRPAQLFAQIEAACAGLQDA